MQPSPQLQLSELNRLIAALQDTSPMAAGQRRAAEAALHFRLLDHLEPHQAAHLIERAALADSYHLARLRSLLCPDTAPPADFPPPPPLTAQRFEEAYPAQPQRQPKPTPLRLWPLPEPLATPLQLDPPDATRRRYSDWQRSGLIPADLNASTLAAAFTRLHGRPPVRRNSNSVYGLMELGRTLMALRQLRDPHQPDPDLTF